MVPKVFDLFQGVPEDSYPLTGKACVDLLVTDLAVFRWTDQGFVVEDVAPGFTEDEVWSLSGFRPRAESQWAACNCQ